MNAIDVLLTLIKQFEGCAKIQEDGTVRAYKCPAGVWTIGYGSTGPDINENTVWFMSRAESVLLETAQQCLQKALDASPRLAEATAGQQAAIADFIYNCGYGAYRASTLRHDVFNGDWEAAKKSILMWNKAHVGGNLVELNGLTRRRQAEAALM